VDTREPSDQERPVILVVDDEEPLRKVVVRALSIQYRVYEAPDARAALALLQRMPLPDAIVCDVTMPGMDGFELARRIKSDPRLHGVPVMFLTAMDEPRDVIAGINSGAWCYLTKPFKMEEVRARLHAMVAKSRGATPSGTQVADTQVAERKKSLLLVDDDSAIRLLVAHALRVDYEVLCAQGGLEALAILEQIEKPDLILCDLMMPGMDGIEFTRTIKADSRFHSIPVIFLTARDDVRARIDGISAGARSYLTKPFTVDYLREQLGVQKVFAPRRAAP
jgi:two-component system cell cycle response regulator